VACLGTCFHYEFSYVSCSPDEQNLTFRGHCLNFLGREKNGFRIIRRLFEIEPS
jgi:hypothetical protein